MDVCFATYSGKHITWNRDVRSSLLKGVVVEMSSRKDGVPTPKPLSIDRPP